MTIFADRLSALMIEKNIPARELAAVLGVSKSTIHDWKRGKNHTFLSKAIKVADFFGCSLDYLMGRSDTDTEISHCSCPPFYTHFLTVLESCNVSAYRMREESRIKGAYFNNWSLF